jgi:hypothetical protein
MLLTQFVTLGLLTLTTAGGAVLGYGLRARQEKLIGGLRLSAEDRNLKVIAPTEAPLAIEGRGRRARAAEDR